MVMWGIGFFAGTFVGDNDIIAKQEITITELRVENDILKYSENECKNTRKENKRLLGVVNKIKEETAVPETKQYGDGGIFNKIFSE